MTKNIWVISDTHFNHANILKFEDKVGKPVRGQFSSVEEMNETMIQRWNEVVKPGDKVYHLGDVVFGTDKGNWLANNMPRLMGSKRLIFGNHDDPEHFVGKGQFKKTSLWRVFKEFNILLTHVPVHESTVMEGRGGSDKPMLNVHGHIHQNLSPSKFHYNACVEMNDYRPVNIEDLAKIAKNI
jgi:calcineurin-like phosphoesterase family protein